GDGTALTAGTTARIADGAAAVLLLPESTRRGAPGLAVRAGATVGVDPRMPGIGPVPAVRRALERAGAGLDDLAAVELVEAYGAQSLAVLDDLGLADGEAVDPRVNATGGALALGHPWGASAAIAVVRLWSRLVRGGAPAGSLGLATAAIGGGMGVAAVLEVVR
ncbi:MAG: acetyl-CoA C-acyltransferase, partial [Microbacteriaceae bacterium]|nr:acetyl-CoA C-acyltransferase [Microbacteriaceae bacterium]